MDIPPPPFEEEDIDAEAESPKVCPIYVISGSMGTVGEQLARTVLSQFMINVPVKIVRRVHHLSRIKEVIEQAAQNRGIILHTIVNADMRQATLDLIAEKKVFAIDMVGPLIEHLNEVLGQEAIGQPGLYRQLHETYYRRIEAIGFTRAHDDGMNYQGWKEAEIVLVGVSRVGKTPLSLYLSMLGWKVANVPLVPGVPPRQELFELERQRVIGLKIDPTELLKHRQHRQKGLGVRGKSDYNNPTKLYEEIEAARLVFRKGGFKVVDVTNKPIETSAGQIIMMVARHSKFLV